MDAQVKNELKIQTGNWAIFQLVIVFCLFQRSDTVERSCPGWLSVSAKALSSVAKMLPERQVRQKVRNMTYSM